MPPQMQCKMQKVEALQYIVENLSSTAMTPDKCDLSIQIQIQRQNTSRKHCACHEIRTARINHETQDTMMAWMQTTWPKDVRPLQNRSDHDPTNDTDICTGNAFCGKHSISRSGYLPKTHFVRDFLPKWNWKTHFVRGLLKKWKWNSFNTKQFWDASSKNQPSTRTLCEASSKNESGRIMVVVSCDGGELWYRWFVVVVSCDIGELWWWWVVMGVICDAGDLWLWYMVVSCGGGELWWRWVVVVSSE